MGRLDGEIAVEVQRHAVLGDQVMRQELTLALHVHETSLLEAEAERLQDLPRLIGDLRIFLSFRTRVTRLLYLPKILSFTTDMYY